MKKYDKTVLVVDDISDNIMLLKTILTRDGYRVKVANNGEKCIDIAKRNPPDLIMLDVMMPGLSGYDVCKVLKEDEITKNIPIIFVTARNEIEDETLGFKLGAVDYINKPISEAIVLARVETHLKLNELINNLNEKVKEETELRVKQEKVLLQQSKAAAMGDMIDAIAHQWKMPLSVISMNLQLLNFDVDNNSNLVDDVKKCINKATLQVEHLDNTINEFRNFFRPNEKDQYFYLHEAIDKTLLLMKDELIKNTISIEKVIQEDLQIKGNINEFKHILLNLLNNAKDAFVENNIEGRKIFIKLYSCNTSQEIIMEVIDNAGGIPIEIIENIFKPNISTKLDSGGTGIGLYLCQQIAQKFGSELCALNVEDGAKFLFKKPILKDEKIKLIED